MKNSGMKYAVAMLAAGGGLAAASHSIAAVITQQINDPPTNPDFEGDIFLDGSVFTKFQYGQDPKTQNTYLTPESTSGIGSVSDTFSLPHAGESYGTDPLLTGMSNTDAMSMTTFTSLVPANGEYVHLKFDVTGTPQNNGTYVGTAYIDGGATLDYIEYEPIASAAPEPAAWMLLIAGVGLSGAALRRRRTTQSVFSV